MNYQIIARKYRPQKFSEVIGQNKIVTILQNALNKNRIGQSYLFSGPRGVGKTTTARILVKYLNCETTDKVIPCNNCPSCTEINRGVSLDYLEIDGASNRGIDQIRELNEQLNFASPKGKYRVFVIDEVHMLTNEAFNALLKSLEEPPPKFIFILCTTESYRIPLTIRSRCQQLFFGYIDVNKIVNHLEDILKKEDHPFAPESLLGLAKKSEGSIRDAENLLEKVIAFSNENTITAQLVQTVLGETPIEKKYAFLTHLTTNNLKENQKLLADITITGYNINEFFYHLVDTLSILIYFKSGIHEPEVLGISNEEMGLIKGLDQAFTLNELFTLSDILFDFIRNLKSSTHYSSIVNYMLIKLHRYKQIITHSELKENILMLSRYVTPDSDIKIEVDSKKIESEEPIKLELSSLAQEDNHNNDSSIDTQKVSISTSDSTSTNQKSNPLSNNTPTPSFANPSNPTKSIPPSYQTSTNDVQRPWTEDDYKTFLQILKEDDIILFRMAITFQFIEMSEKVLILKDQNNYDQTRLEQFTKDLTNYLNLTKHHQNPLLKKIMLPMSSKQGFTIEIKQNIVQSNLEKIKKIFPIAE